MLPHAAHIQNARMQQDSWLEDETDSILFHRWPWISGHLSGANGVAETSLGGAIPR